MRRHPGGWIEVSCRSRRDDGSPRAHPGPPNLASLHKWDVAAWRVCAHHHSQQIFRPQCGLLDDGQPAGTPLVVFGNHAPPARANDRPLGFFSLSRTSRGNSSMAPLLRRKRAADISGGLGSQAAANVSRPRAFRHCPGSSIVASAVPYVRPATNVPQPCASFCKNRIILSTRRSQARRRLSSSLSALPCRSLRSRWPRLACHSRWAAWSWVRPETS